jgi:hypothetical protein
MPAMSDRGFPAPGTLQQNPSHLYHRAIARMRCIMKHSPYRGALMARWQTRTPRRDRHALDHAEIARRLAGPRNGVVAAMDFVEGRDAAAKGAANPQRQSCGFTLALIFCASLQRGIVQWASVSRVAANRIILASRRRRAPRNSFGYFSLLPARERVWLIA